MPTATGWVGWVSWGPFRPELVVGFTQQFLGPPVGVQVRLDLLQYGGLKFGEPMACAQTVVQLGILGGEEPPWERLGRPRGHAGHAPLYVYKRLGSRAL